jgi:hypothetical protein
VYDPMGEFFPSYGPIRTHPLDGPLYGEYAPGGWHDERAANPGPPPSFPTVEVPPGWQPEEVFAPPPLSTPRGPRPQYGPRRGRRRASEPEPTRVLGSMLEALTAVTTTVVCVLGYLLSYGPLRHIALSRVPDGLSQPWPVIIYGPWLAGCLSVIRAALDGRQAIHSWVVVVLFSSVATALCIVDVPRTPSDMVVAGLPPITSLVSLHQLVRQLRCSRSPHRAPARSALHRAAR